MQCGILLKSVCMSLWTAVSCKIALLSSPVQLGSTLRWLQQLQHTHITVQLRSIFVLGSKRHQAYILPCSFCNALLHLVL